MKTLFLSMMILLISGMAFAQWTSLNSGVTTDLDDIYFLNASTGYLAGGYGAVLKTTDGGASWQASNVSPLPFPQKPWLHSVYFTSATTGYVVGGGCWKTTDGGSTWIEQTTNWTTTALFSVCFTSADTGYIAGGNGNIIKTTNAGANWTLQSSGSGTELHAISFVKSSGWAAGNFAVLHTTNGGTNWLSQSVSSSVIYYDCEAISQNICYASGTGGTIIKTTNGGANWVTQTTGTVSDITDLFFLDSITGYACGGQGTILKTINGGTTWTTEASGMPTGILFSVFFPQAGVGYICGGSGLLIKSSVVGIDDPSPTKASLKLYPNPACDHFTLDAAHLKTGDKIMINDFMGRSIQLIEISDPKASFDCRGLTQGMYTIQIISENKSIASGKLIISGN